jgi:S-adenosylmethionine-diacylglycerol 3-amino-3-carboxypropyl transferase
VSVRDSLFDAFQRRHLIYNACWEDPAIDRQACGFGPADRALVITSGGCNALDYLLAGAGAVAAVDSNPCQGALLEFKAAAIRGLDYAAFWELFGAGRAPRAREFYRDGVRHRLSPWARRYWDRHLHYFDGRGWRGSFYYHGGWGTMMWLMVRYWYDCRGLRRPIRELFAARSLEEQRQVYESRLRGRLWTPGFSWLSSRRLVLALMGIPERQRKFLLNFPGGLFRRGQAVIEELVATIPFAANPFFRVYLLGSYTPDCCPEYLTPHGFARLRAGLLDRLTVHTATVTEHLQRPGPAYSRFVLLDHMDWLDVPALTEEWEAVLARAAPGAVALFRSALPDVEYLRAVPVRYRGRQTTLGELLRFDRERAAALHSRDRVHMYGSFHIAALQSYISVRECAAGRTEEKEKEKEED